MKKKLNNKILISNICDSIRKLVLKITFENKVPHIGSNFSIVEILVSIYFKVLRENKDLFILSKGHACLSLYSLLFLKKKISFKLLKSYSKNNSILMTHSSHKVPGIQFSTGSLGHGLPIATGVALASKIKKIKKMIYVLISDGEINEGTTWESFLFINHHNLNNIKVILDNNNLMSLGNVKDTLNFHPLKKKIENFGFVVSEVDGHNMYKLSNVLKKKYKKPHFIIAKTIKGKGIDIFENDFTWHYKYPNKEQYLKFSKKI